MTIKYPLATFTWNDDEYAAIQRVVASNHFSMGDEVRAFEAQFAAYVGARHAVMVNSGSSANLLMIAALFYTQDDGRKLERGDEVIVPAVSWSTTYFPLQQYGLKIKFVDIDRDTLNIDMDALKGAISDKTKAILAVNLLGNPCDYGAIAEMTKDRNILLLEDNCESLGASFEGRQCGTFGLMGTYSTFFSHHISTMEGGVICTDDDELHHILLCLRAHGWTRNLPDENHVTGTKNPDPFEESFRFVLPGYNVRPLEMEGALGVEQVKKLPLLISERQANGRRWTEAMQNHPQFVIQQETGSSSWFGFSLVIRPGLAIDRRSVVQRLRDLGFECRPIVAGNFAKNPVVRYFDAEIAGPLDNADYIDQNGLFIGNQHFPIPEAIDCIAALRV